MTDYARWVVKDYRMLVTRLKQLLGIHFPALLAKNVFG
jgi:hypothetical protein